MDVRGSLDLSVTWEMAYQSFVGALIGAAIFLVAIVIMEWFGP